MLIYLEIGYGNTFASASASKTKVQKQVVLLSWPSELTLRTTAPSQSCSSAVRKPIWMARSSVDDQLQIEQALAD